MINSGLFVLLFFHALHCQLMRLFLLNNTRLISLKKLSDFCRRCRNIWGYMRHPAHAMFKSTRGNIIREYLLGSWKPSECQMGGELISLLCLLCLKDALRSTINSNVCSNACATFGWSTNGVDGQTIFYVLQTDWMLIKWLPDCEKKSTDYLLILPLVQPNVTLILIGAAIMRK